MALNVAIAIAALGFLPLVIVLWKRRRVRNLVEKGHYVSGRILEVYTHRGHKGNTYYRALIEYPVFNRAPLQRFYTFSGKKGLEIFYKGRWIELYYDKEKPERFIPKEASKNNGFLVFAIIIAIVYIALCFFLYDFMKKEGVA